MQSPLNVPIILASTSPRRIELMNAIQLPCLVESPPIKEVHRRGETPRQMVRRLAKEKAVSVIPEVLRKLGAAVIIAADTIVVAPDGGKILGKPENTSDAIRMLRKLVGKTHTVLTGYCILSIGRGVERECWVRVVTSRVKMRPLSEKGIRNYIQLDKPFDKAGSYAAQGLGMALIESINGSYTNVVGLPVTQLLKDLEKRFGIFPWEK